MLRAPIVEVLASPLKCDNIRRAQFFDGVIQVIFIVTGDAVHPIPCDLTGDIRRQTGDIRVGFAEEVYGVAVGILRQCPSPENADGGAFGCHGVDRDRVVYTALRVFVVEGQFLHGDFGEEAAVELVNSGG